MAGMPEREEIARQQTSGRARQLGRAAAYAECAVKRSCAAAAPQRHVLTQRCAHEAQQPVAEIAVPRFVSH